MFSIVTNFFEFLKFIFNWADEIDVPVCKVALLCKCKDLSSGPRTHAKSACG